MFRQLLQPISVEPNPNAFQHLIRSRVVGVEGLAWLHVLDPETNKRALVGGIPQIVKARTDFELALPLIREGVVWVDRHEIVPDIDGALIAVLANWNC